MVQPRLVLACGHVACLKTTITLAVAPRLSMNIVATYGMGPFDRSSDAALECDRQLRYEKLFSIAEAYLRAGLSIWIDGNFPKRVWRRRLWALAALHRVEEVAVLQCICSDETMLEERFERRRADTLQPDASANDMSAYHGSVRQFESIEPDEIENIATSEIIVHDSCRHSIQPQVPLTTTGRLIRDALAASGLVRQSGDTSEESSTD
jgi:predicted kinase